MENRARPIAVVMPVYNKKNNVSRSIESVLNQNYENFHLIIVNDGSTDESEKIIKQYTDPRIEYINQNNQGVSVARNNGTMSTRAELIAYIDADDEWINTHLSDLVLLAKHFPAAGLYATGWWAGNRIKIEGVASGKENESNKSHFLLDNYLDSVLSKKIPVWTSAAMVRKEAFDRAGGFPEGAQHGEDHALWLAIGLQYPVAISKKRSAIYWQDEHGLASKPPPGPDACMEFIQNMLKTSRGKKIGNKLMELYCKFSLAHAITAMFANEWERSTYFLRLAKSTSMFYRKRLILNLINKWPAVGRIIVKVWQKARMA